MTRLQTINTVFSVSPRLITRYASMPREIKLRKKLVVKLPQATPNEKLPLGKSRGCISRTVVPIGHLKMPRLPVIV